MVTRYVHHDPQAAESPGAGFPGYDDLVAENARLRDLHMKIIRASNKSSLTYSERLFDIRGLAYEGLQGG